MKRNFIFLIVLLLSSFAYSKALDHEPISYTFDIDNKNLAFANTKVWISDIDSSMKHRQSEKSFDFKKAIADTFKVHGQGYLQIQYDDKDDGLIMGIGKTNDLLQMDYSFKITITDNKVTLTFHKFISETRDFDDNDLQMFDEYAEKLEAQLKD